MMMAFADSKLLERYNKSIPKEKGGKQHCSDIVT
jgi:hypothetical protein